MKITAITGSPEAATVTGIPVSELPSVCCTPASKSNRVPEQIYSVAGGNAALGAVGRVGPPHTTVTGSGSVELSSQDDYKTATEAVEDGKTMDDRWICNGVRWRW
jgi:hypothetical protein